MLKELLINNLAVIKNCEMDFTTRYTALVGETGAGKSLIVDALSLLKGQKADFSLIRDKDKKSSISALFVLNQDFLKKHPSLEDIIDDENQLLIRRVIQKDHTSKFYINDELYTANEYKKIVEHLIDIHSQGANSDILDPNKQLFYLDTYGKEEIKAIKAKFQVQYQVLEDNETKLNQLLNDNRGNDREYLEFQIKAIEKYHLKENEIEELNDEFDSLREFEQLQNKHNMLLELIDSSDPSLLEQLSKVKSHLISYENTQLKEAAERLIGSINGVIENYDSFEEVFSSLDIDPRRIDDINARLFELKDLQRKYGKTTHEILLKLSQFKEKLENIDSFEVKKYNLEKEIEKSKEQCLRLASELSKKRHEIAIKLSEHINCVLVELGLAGDGFSIMFNTRDLSNEGTDKISFQIQMNKGLDTTSLEKAASGGEASRLMLAIKSVLNDLDPYDLLIFDEVDTGVSGRIASLVAQKIREMSKSSQIIVISHLPQVVASSSSAFKVYKDVVQNETISSVQEIDEDELIYEVARLISGAEITDSAIEQAKELRSDYIDE